MIKDFQRAISSCGSGAERSRRRGHLLGRFALGAAIAALAAPAIAAEAPKPPETADEGLGDIIVTAQRRSESIQKVPLSVTAFSSDTLQLAGIGKVADLQQIDSSTVISAQSGAVIPFVRGIGNPASATPGNESSVPIYIDDAYYSRLFPAYLSFADNIERVEVLKGPQGTLFGRNSTGGLIHIHTRDPGQDKVLRATVGYGSQQTVTGKLYVATPLTETLAVDFSFSGQDMGKGFGKNVFTGGDAYFVDFYTLRSKLVWTPTDDTTVRLSGFYVRENSSVGTVQGGGLKGFPRGFPPNYTSVFAQPSGYYDIATNFPTVRRHKGHGATLKIDQSLGVVDFSSVSFYRKSKDPWTSEGDHTPVRWLQYFLPVVDKQFTQELQLKSKEHSKVSWILGLYYMNAKAVIDPTSITGQAIELGGSDSFNLVGKQKTDSKAAYAQATVPVTDEKTNITIGLRYTEDKVDGFGQQYVILTGTGQKVFVAPDYVDSAKFNKLTYKASIDHSFSDDVMGYASYSRGFKSGTFNLLPLDQPALNPEQVDAYEIGLKSTLANGRVRFNIAAFQNDIKNPQVWIVKVVAGVASNQLANAEKARTRGVEIDGSARIAHGLTARFSGQYLDAKFVRFLNAPVVTPNFSPPYGVISGSGDVSGNRLPQAPRWKFNVGLTSEIDSGIGSLVMDANLSYRSGYPWEADNVAKERSLTLVNTSITLTPSFNEDVSVRLWAKNLTDEKYNSNLLTQAGPVGFMTSPAEPRTWGVEFSYKF